MAKKVNLKEGREYQVVILECPNCDESERWDTEVDVQPENFELLHTSPSGTIRVWLCRNCEQVFYTNIS